MTIVRIWIAVVAYLSTMPLAAAPPEDRSFLRPPANVPNGRQIVSRGEDRFWVLVPDWPKGILELQSVRREHPRSDYVRDGSIRLGRFDPAQTQSAMIVDQRGRLAWTASDGDAARYQAIAADSVAECLSRGADLPRPEEQWTVREAALGDMLLLPDGAPCVGLVRREGPECIISLRWKAGDWCQCDVARGRGLRPPVMDVAGDWLLLTWCDGGGRIWFQRVSWRELGKRSPEPPQEIGWPGRRPSILASGGKVFVAYEEWWNEIVVKVLDGRVWHAFQLTARHPQFTVDVSHSAHLALDGHGVPWLFFSDASRHFVYYARWLGGDWSDISDARGIFQRAPYNDTSLLSADWLSVEKHPCGAQVHMVLANANSGVVACDAVPVVMPQAAPGRRMLFLDMLEAARIDGLDRRLTPATKDPANPVFTPSPDCQAFDHLRVFNHGTVLYENGRFRMWYAGMKEFPGSVPWWHWLMTGYAESADGRHFDRVRLPAGTASGGPGGNALAALPFVVPLCRDDEDPDPVRRYKLISFLNAGLKTEAAAAGTFDLDAQYTPGTLFTSPDGVRWAPEPAEIQFPGGPPIELVPLCLLKDRDEPDPQRRWKAYGFSSITYRRRAGAMAYSTDARHWIAYPRNPVLDPQTSRMPIVPAGRISQIHDMVVWRDAGLYLSLFQDQRSMESLPLELAVSRDGVHFTYVQRGEPFIAEGGPNDWDSLELLPSSPVVVGDEVWFYYGGSARGKGQPDEGRRTSAGLARVRQERFTCLQVQDGRNCGSITTVPFAPAARCRLSVNADCGAEGSIRVELLGTDGRPLPQYAAADCRLITGDSVRIPVTWSQRRDLRAEGRFRICFHLQGPHVRLYAFGFDP